MHARTLSSPPGLTTSETDSTGSSRCVTPERPLRTKRTLDTISDDDEPRTPTRKPKRGPSNTKPKAVRSKRKTSNNDSILAQRSDVPKAPKYVGIPSGNGHARNPPPNSNSVTWHCGNKTCNSGQTWYSIEETGRKVDSDAFGRNKKETKRIPEQVWHYRCRICYQQTAYWQEKLTKTQKGMARVDSWLTQITRIEIWWPTATFDVQLKHGARVILHEAHRREHLSPGISKAELDQAMKQEPKMNRHDQPIPLRPEHDFPVSEMRELDAYFCGPDKRISHLREILEWTRERLQSGKIATMPPIEFLIDEPIESEILNPPEDNYAIWARTEGPRVALPPIDSLRGSSPEGSTLPPIINPARFAPARLSAQRLNDSATDAIKRESEDNRSTSSEACGSIESSALNDAIDTHSNVSGHDGNNARTQSRILETHAAPLNMLAQIASFRLAENTADAPKPQSSRQVSAGTTPTIKKRKFSDPTKSPYLIKVLNEEKKKRKFEHSENPEVVDYKIMMQRAGEEADTSGWKKEDPW